MLETYIWNTKTYRTTHAIMTSVDSTTTIDEVHKNTAAASILAAMGGTAINGTQD